MRVYPCPEEELIIMIAMIVMDGAEVRRIGGQAFATKRRGVNGIQEFGIRI